MWFQPAVCYLSGEQKVHRNAQRCQRFPWRCTRGSAASSACRGLCGEKGKVLLQVSFQMYKPLPRCYLQVLTPLGKMVTPSLGLLLLTGYISNIKKKNTVFDASSSAQEYNFIKMKFPAHVSQSP